MGRFYSSGDKEAKPVQHTNPYTPVTSIKTRGFAEPQTYSQTNSQANQAQTQKDWSYTPEAIAQRTQDFRDSMARISFEPRPQDDFMERKGKEINAKQQAKIIQAKLAIGAAGDKYEQEADKVASQVVQTINTPENVQREEERVQAKSLDSIQREAIPEEEEELQMKPVSNSIQRDEALEEEDEELQMKPMLQRREAVEGGDASEELESSIQQAKGSGQSLDPSLQEKMGQAMGADFSSVKVHTDSQSDQLNQSIQAKAFTTGKDVFFRQGAYEPSSRSGQELIAHELTHVVQQSGGASVVQREKFIGEKPKHHLHIEINQDHYKFGTDKGSRIEIGKNGIYKLDQLIVARNYLVNNSHTTNGGQECITWLESECESHADWDESIGYQPSWDIEESDENQHTEGILEHGGSFGYKREDFENTLIQAKNEVLEEESKRIVKRVNEDDVNGTGNVYGRNVKDGEDPTAEKFEETIECLTLVDLLPQWSGFNEDSYSKDDLAEDFKKAAKEHLRLMLLDKFPLSTGKYEE